MLWFDGSIKSAVNRVKTSSITLLIFVQGNDELSNVYNIFLNEKTFLNPDEYVALKIQDTSLAFRQFKEIYYSVPVPSIFFIKNNGIPLKIISSKDTNDIKTAIADVFGKNESIKLVKCIQGNNSENGSGLTTNYEALEKKKEMASNVTSSKHLYAKNVGFQLFDITEDEIKQRLSEIRSFPRFLLINNSSQDPSTLPYPISKIHSVRIQFRLPNNDLPSWEFPDMSTLADVRAYLMEKVNLSPNFKLLQACPRRGFTPEDEHKTLIDLSLTPNAILIVIPVQDKTVQARVRNIVVQQNFASLVLKTLFQPFVIFINYFKKYVLKIPIENPRLKPSRMPSNTTVGKTLNKKTSTSNIFGFNFDEDADYQNDFPELITPIT